MNGYLVIGLGSMGKRRIRCLIELSVNPSEIYGYDVRKDRCDEAREYGINIVNNIDEFDFELIKGVIISLPPDKHSWGVSFAQKNHKPVFIEASVVLNDVQKIKENNPDDVFLAPSCTFRFHPMIKVIREIVKEQKYGRVCNFSYHSGQYLPDWHPWEDVNDFYVGNRLTGGAREIVPYELTWMVEILGFPNDIKGYFRKTGNTGANIEDTYSCCLEYEDKLGVLVVDVVSRYPARNLIINFEYGQIQWRWDNSCVELYDARSGKTQIIKEEEQIHHEGYSSMIGENMYIDEVKAFIDGIEDRSKYPTDIDYDIKILKLLEKIENSNGGF